MAKRPVPLYDFKAFGAAIKAARNEYGESRKKVSDELYISPRYLANIENKGQQPSLQVFYDLVTRYHISVDQFFFPNSNAEKSTGRRQLDALLDGMSDKGIAVKKIKAVKKSKGMSGKPVTSKPVYGYVMDEDENFIIDEEAAPVVQQIYQLCLAGNGPTKIARMLTEQQIPTPGTLEYQRTGSTRRYHPGYECKWATNTVVHILENREYTGCLVNFKTEKPSYKVKHSIENPVEKQAIFENHHEPIIDKETWERVQELRKQRKRPNRYDEVGLFSGILFCADCGHVLYQQRYQNKDRKQDCYICGSYKKRTRNCTAHFIRTDLLTAGVLANLRQVTEYAAKHESRFVKLLVQQNEIGGKRKTAAAIKQLEQAQERISEISRIIKRLYEDNVNGKISDERFMELSADYEAEQAELKKRAAALQAELDKSQAATVNAEKFMGIVRKHLAFEELTPTLLREMIEKIVVHECSYDENGTRRQDIEIYYSFVGKIDLPE